MNPSDGRKGQDLPHSSVEREEFLLRAETHLKEKQFQETLLLARKRIDLHPDDADARLIFGIALLRMGREQEALAVFEEMGEDILRWVLVFEFLGDIYNGRGEAEKARTCYQSLISLESDPLRVKRLLEKIDLGNSEKEPDERVSGGVSVDFKTLTMAELYLKQGHLEQAAQVLEEISQEQPGNKKVSGLLREVRSLLWKRTCPREGKSAGAVIEELNRWLLNSKGFNRGGS